MEAGHVNKDLRESFALKNGYESFEHMEAMDPEKAAAAKEKAGDAASKTFIWNSFALAVPNFVQSKAFNSWMGGSKATMSDQMRAALKTGKAPEQVKKEMLKNKSYLKAVGTGILFEGL